MQTKDMKRRVRQMAVSSREKAVRWRETHIYKMDTWSSLLGGCGFKC